MQCIADIRKHTRVSNFEYFLTQFLRLVIQLKWIEEDARSSSPNRLQGATLAFTWRTEENHEKSKTADLRELDLGSEYEAEMILQRCTQGMKRWTGTLVGCRHT